MHDEHRFSVQAFASMDWENNKRTWPCDGEDATTSVGGGAAVLSRCPSYAATSITPAFDEETGEVHDGVWEDITRGDGDTTRGDGDAEDTGEPTRHGTDGHFGVVESWDLNRHTCNGKTLRQTFLLQDTVIFLLPSALMSARRRAIILPEIRRKGGEVTEYPSAATHRVMTPFPVGEQRLKQLCTKYGVPDSCIVVPESFLLVGSSTSWRTCR